ncbi:MAG: type IX secretion system membrane protein PorP/SprF [Bacteroidia bacterium]|nr:type IX secretion system membrane protein PorP/SprF [Bacteroidia bacterium]
MQFLQNQEAFNGNSSNKVFYTLANHWMLHASYKIELNENFELEPYLLYRKVKNAPGQADINFFLNWLNKGYAGIAYRDGMSFSTMLGVQVSNAITVGYAFDATTHKLRTALGNTHEVVMKFELGKPSSSANSGLTKKEKEAYELKIEELSSEVNSLKSAPLKSDTIIIEKTVIKEVIKEVPVEVIKVVKEVPKEVPPKVKTPTKPKETPKTTTSEFYVIAGSFANSKAAQSYISTLKLKGHTGYEHFDKKSGRTYVHMGNFSEKDKAILLINRLKDSGLPLWVKTM